MKFMPFFLPVFSFSLPAAIVFYFLVSNLYRIAQQYYITRSMYHGEDSLGGQLRKNREDSPKDGKGGGAKAGGSKSGGSKSGGSKSGGSKSGGSKAGSAKKNGSGGAKKKSKTSTAARTGAPGRNSSGRQASARASVQPRARKKKKR